jgi:hypothetical protein
MEDLSSLLHGLKTIMKRFASFLLALMMVAGSFAAMPLTAYAADFTVANASQLLAAIASAPDNTPVTIKITQYMYTNSPVTINNKIITFDVGDDWILFFDALTINNSKIDYVGGPDGSLGISGGINITDSVASFRYLSAGGGSLSPFLLNNSDVTIADWGVFTQDRSYVGLTNNSTLTVNGDFEGADQMVYSLQCGGNSQVIINGDFVGKRNGIYAYGGGTVTVNGSIEKTNTVKVNDGVMSASDGIPSTTKPGYLEYSDGSSYIWVRELYELPTYYEVYDLDELCDAIWTMPDNVPCTVKLMADFDEEEALVSSLYMDNKNITFDTNGYLLMFHSMDVNNSDLVFDGDIYVMTYPGIVINRSTVTINGDLKSGGYYIDAYILDSNRSTVTINGSVTSDSGGVRAQGSGSTVAVTGDISAEWNGAVGYNRGSVTVGGDVLVYQYYAVYAELRGSVTIDGSAEADYSAVRSSDNSTIIVKGDVRTTGEISGNEPGVEAVYDSTVKIDGKITVEQGIYLSIDYDEYASGDYTLPTTLVGYLTYTNGESTVWVKETGANVPEPLYTVTIPSELKLAEGDNQFNIEVSNAENLGDKKVIITLERTQHNNGGSFAQTLWANGNEPDVFDVSLDYNNQFFHYEIYVPYSTSYAGVFSAGAEFAVFAGNGVQNSNIRISASNAARALPEVPYTGYIIFGIKLE